MKIKTKADVMALDNKIQQELGVDIGKYRDEEVVARVGELMVFPVYVIQWVLRPPIIALVLFIASFFVLDLSLVDYVFYGILGLVLWLIGGLLSGVLLLTYRFREDLSALLAYSTSILRDVVTDVDTLNAGTTKENRGERLLLLYRGVLHLVTIPVAADVIGNKVPLVGGVIAGVVRWVLTVAANTFASKKNGFTVTPTESDDQEPGKILPVYVNSVNRFNTVIQRALEIGIQLVQFPFKVGLIMLAALLMLLIYLVN
ncbi:hypothetical protein [Lewinella sp. W8]|uniref:hypothetical protein n=1 Tax=Lewinella sp. W8 TaxID=2528208 RepID=UPI0010688C74|nr:hypothetical protein [Lewinella sp. W8]MTB50787.1 hypothetical protein [Lewinella sp. W8]